MKNRKLKIVLFGDPVLREEAKPVTVYHSKLHALIDSMADALDKRDDGAALAANQVGVLKRISVIDYEGEYIEMINPVLLESSGEDIAEEGCLSYPGYFGMVPRAENVKVKYCDREGKEIIIERSGKMARCLQHEIDHLNGILFIDRMKEKTLIYAEDEKVIDIETAFNLVGGKKIIEN
jgi:peptide deformylase